MGRGSSPRRAAPAAEQPRVAGRGADPRQVARARRLLRERDAIGLCGQVAPRPRLHERGQPLGRLRRLEAERLRLRHPGGADARAAGAVLPAPPDPGGRRGGPAAPASVAHPPDRRRRPRVARVALSRRRRRRDDRDHRRRRRRRLEPPAADRPLDGAPRRAEGRVREADDRGPEPGRDGRAVPGAARLGERRADPRPRVGRDCRRHGQLPDPLSRQRRLRLARHPGRARVDLSLRRAGHRLPPRQRAVLSLPLPVAAAARAGAELRRGRRPGRAARHRRARCRRARRSS